MCRIEGQKAMKCVPFAVNVYAYVKCSSSHAQSTLQPCHQLMKLRIMTINIKTKVLVKFGTSEMMYVELRTKSYEMCTVRSKCICIYVKCSSSHAQNTLQPCHLS